MIWEIRVKALGSYFCCLNCFTNGLLFMPQSVLMVIRYLSHWRRVQLAIIQRLTWAWSWWSSSNDEVIHKNLSGRDDHHQIMKLFIKLLMIMVMKPKVRRLDWAQSWLPLWKYQIDLSDRNGKIMTVINLSELRP